MNEYYFTIGSQVYYEDGKCGKLAKVVIDPETWRVTDLVAEEGFLLKRARVFPITVVASATAEEVHLAIPSYELAHFREYSEKEYEIVPEAWDPAIRPAPELFASDAAIEPLSRDSRPLGAAPPLVRQKVRLGVDDHLVVAGKNTEIAGRTGALGHLHCIIANVEAGRITGLMLRSGLLDNERMFIPARLIESLGDDRIRVPVTKDELEETNIDIAQSNSPPG